MPPDVDAEDVARQIGLLEADLLDCCARYCEYKGDETISIILAGLAATMVDVAAGAKLSAYGHSQQHTVRGLLATLFAEALSDYDTRKGLIS